MQGRRVHLFTESRDWPQGQGFIAVCGMKLAAKVGVVVRWLLVSTLPSS
jgi:hypothetical protein